MLRILLLPGVCFGNFYSSSAQSVRRTVTASYNGICAYSGEQADVLSFATNPAALPQTKNAGVAVYGERRFLLPELSRYAINAGFTTTSGAFGWSMLHTGGGGYAETSAGIAYGRKLGARISAGVQFNYYSIRASGYGQSAAISFAAGTLLTLTDKLRGGVCAINPAGGKFGKDHSEKLPSVYSLGLGYDASQKCFIGMEIVKEEDLPVNVNAGVHYAFHQRCFVRAGVAAVTGSFWAGAGLLVNAYRLDVICNYHPQLGISPGLLILFNIRRKQS